MTWGLPRDFDLVEYWRLALKHRLLIIGIFLAVVVAGLAFTLLQTPTYTATASLQIDRQAAQVLDINEVAPRESLIQGEEFFQTQYGLLRSRSLAERVIDNLGLARSDEFLVAMGGKPISAEGSAATRASDRREAVLEVISDNLDVSPVRGSRLVEVSFTSPDPVLSARIANAFAENFIQSNLDRKYQSSSYAREFLETLIAQTKAKLEDAERQLVAYAAQQQIINVTEPGTGPQANNETQSLSANNLAALNGALADARAQRIAAEAKWRQARGASVTALPEVLGNAAVQNLLQERARVDAEYQQKLQVYQPAFPEMVQLRARLDELDTQVNRLAGSIRTSIQGEYNVAVERERVLAAQVNGLKAEVLDLRSRSIQYNILQREVDTSRTLYDGLLQRYKEVGVTGGVTTNNISIIDGAQEPTRPSGPRIVFNMALAALAGLTLGVVAAFLLEALDETLATPDDVESKLGMPVLGVIPILDKGMSPRSALEDIRSSFSEAYYSLRTALQFSTPNGTPAVMLVTSSQPAEGKSTTAFTTALNLSRIGKRVLLVDGDLRNPSMHRVVGVDNEKGMSNVLAGASTMDEVINTTAYADLSFIPCGPLPPNPADLWGGQRLRAFLEEARSRFDHIVIDGPPVLGFADAPVLSTAVDGTLFMVESKSTRRGQARGALRRLSMGRGRVLGIVLTKFDTKTTQYGGYDYAYDYNYGGGQSGGASGKSGRRK